MSDPEAEEDDEPAAVFDNIPECPHCAIIELLTTCFGDLSDAEVLKSLMLVAVEAIESAPSQHRAEGYEFVKAIIDHYRETANQPLVVVTAGPDDESGTAH